MALLPFAWVRGLAGLLHPLRVLVAQGWLRESDVDAGLALLHPALRLNRVFARVTQRQWVADDMLELTLRANGNWRGAKPGQHVQLYLERDGRAPEPQLQPDGVAGAWQPANRHQAAGRWPGFALSAAAVWRWATCWNWGRCMASCSWPAPAQGVLLLAAGSGITPLLGLLRVALAQGFSAPVTLLHYVREQGQRAFVAELQALQAQYSNLQVRCSLTAGRCRAGESGWAFYRRASGCMCRNWPHSSVLACGPAGFVGQVQQWWQGAGQSGLLQVEAFTPPALIADVGLRQVSLRFARSQ